MTLTASTREGHSPTATGLAADDADDEMAEFAHLSEDELKRMRKNMLQQVSHTEQIRVCGL
jgi:hypothetical protein